MRTRAMKLSLSLVVLLLFTASLVQLFVSGTQALLPAVALPLLWFVSLCAFFCVLAFKQPQKES